MQNLRIKVQSFQRLCPLLQISATILDNNMTVFLPFVQKSVVCPYMLEKNPEIFLESD